MNLKQIYATKNECYKTNKAINPIAIVVHSTGANNPNLARYVKPDDGEIGTINTNQDFNEYRPGGRQICPHAVIGKQKDGSIATVQILSWTHRGWHVGSGQKGTLNDTAIGFEICEDDLTDETYFRKVYQEAVELCTYLCKKYEISIDKIYSHKEAHALGLGSNHGDPDHWFSRFGKTMDDFRSDVQNHLEPNKIKYTIQLGAFSKKTNAYNYLREVKKHFSNAFLKEI